MCLFHKWKYISLIPTFRWLGGVCGGVKIATESDAQKCEKCGKIKLLNRNEG